jgi:hypothetical protein
VNSDRKKLCEWASAEVEATLIRLPKPLREQVKKLPVTLERRPNAELQADGIEVDALGLFVGPDFADVEHVPLPPQIILFLENLWGLQTVMKRFFARKCGRLFCTRWDIILDWMKTD